MQNGEGQVTFADLDLWFGKTSPEPSPAPEKDTPGKISRRSSKKSSKSSSRKPPLCLCLSVAWRVHDGQFWGATLYSDDGILLKRGTPQRRRRISLVADFGGMCAPEVSFVRKSLSGHQEPGEPAGEEAAAAPGAGPGECDRVGKRGGGGKGPLIQEDVSATISCNNDQTLFAPKVYGICSDQSHAMLSDNPHSGVYEAETTRTLDANGGNPGCNQGGMAVVESYAIQGSMIGRSDKNGPQGDGINKEVSFTLDTVDRHAVCSASSAFGIDRAAFNQGKNAQYSFSVDEEVEPTMVAKGPGAVAVPVYSSSHSSYHTSASEEVAGALIATDYKDPPLINEAVPEYTVRRLTPTECARLQGYPSDWCDIPDTVVNGKVVKYSDSAAYKAYGNSICLPFWDWLLKRIAACYERPATMGSLFDGIGGFPLIWERINGKGMARWASEIEPFPIAVTKYHFPEEE